MYAMGHTLHAYPINIFASTSPLCYTILGSLSGVTLPHTASAAMLLPAQLSLRSFYLYADGDRIGFPIPLSSKEF